MLVFCEIVYVWQNVKAYQTVLGQKVEANQMFITLKTDKWIVVHPYNKIQFSKKEKEKKNAYTGNDMDEFLKH